MQIRSKPLVSVIIITLNAEKTIERCLVSVFNQSYPKSVYEVILVDGNSKDRTREIASKYPVRIVIEKRLGYGRARNVGVEHAKGEIIAFIDADTYADPLWLDNLVKYFEKGAEAVTGPNIRFSQEGSWFSELLLTPHIRPSEGREVFHGVASHGHGHNMAFLREALLGIGGFDEELPGAEDKEILGRLAHQGYNSVFAPDAIVYHPEPSSVKEWLTDKFLRDGVARALSFRKNGFDWSGRPPFLRCFSFIMLLFAYLICFITHSPFLLIFVTMALACLIFVRYRFYFYVAIRQFKRTRKAGWFLYPILRILAEFFTVLGFIYGYMKPIQLKS